MIIWVIQFDNDLYVVGANESGWVSMIGNGGPVQLRMQDKTYALNASPVTSRWEAVLEAYQNKYRADYPEIINDFPTLDEAKGTTSVFKLSKD